MNETQSSQSEHILIIKLSALGDIVQSFGPVRAIRQHHPKAQITVLTTKPYVSMFEACPDVDEVWIDTRPKWHQFGAMRDLISQLRSHDFIRVYDLQTSGRSSQYRKLMNGLCPLSCRKVPEWSGIAKGCSHPHANPRRDFMHTIERQAEQLEMAGIANTPFPNIDWLEGDVSGLGLPENFLLLVPGGAPHRPDKRWPVEHFSGLAQRAMNVGITPVVLGTAAEADAIDAIMDAVPGAVNLCGKTGFADIATLGRMAWAAVGNDTGPMHMLAVSGCACVAVYSQASDPALCAQRGPNVAILRENSLKDLSIDAVWQQLKKIAAFPA